MAALPARHRDNVLDRRHHDEAERRLQMQRNQPAIALLRSWLEDGEESEEEQRQSLEWLMRVLDEDRPSDRKLFP